MRAATATVPVAGPPVDPAAHPNAAVRLLHLVLYVDASRRGNAGGAAIAGFALTVLIGMALLLAGAFAAGWVKALL